jgi:alkylation response protein AidB-like acyl-CoA dehydrogenase
MFVMMNAARLGVGNQSLGLTEVAYQNAVAYAKERLQMRALSGPKAPDKPADPIIVHPDVRKMLLTARAYAEGGRALAVYTVLQLDKELEHPDEDVRQEAADELALLTPIIKAFLTDNGWLATSTACRSSAATATSRVGHGAVRARRAHQHDLRGHQHHPVAGPAGPQGAGRQRQEAQEVSARRSPPSSRRRACARTCRSSSTRWPTWATRSPS